MLVRFEMGRLLLVLRLELFFTRQVFVHDGGCWPCGRLGEAIFIRGSCECDCDCVASMLAANIVITVQIVKLIRI